MEDTEEDNNEQVGDGDRGIKDKEFQSKVNKLDLGCSLTERLPSQYDNVEDDSNEELLLQYTFVSCDNKFMKLLY